MDVERFKGQEQPDLPGMPQELKRERPKFNTGKRKPIIPGDDRPLTPEEMQRIREERYSKNEEIEIEWGPMIFDLSGYNSNSEPEESVSILYGNNGKKRSWYVNGKKSNYLYIKTIIRHELDTLRAKDSKFREITDKCEEEEKKLKLN